jgi:hypothetical protein
MEKEYRLFIFILLCVGGVLYADPRIALFFQPERAVEIENMTAVKKLHKELRMSHKLSHHMIPDDMKASLVEGIIATYGGYIGVSDHNGELSFPRKHQKSIIDVIITPEIVPVSLFESTIMHWKRVAGIPAILYRCEEKYDAQAEEYYWETQQSALPDDMIIPLAAIVIIADPHDIRIELGRSSTNETGNLILPHVYVKKEINTELYSSYILTIRHLFKPIQTEENREPLEISTQIID